MVAFAVISALVAASTSLVTAIPLDTKTVENALPAFIGTNLGDYASWYPVDTYPAVPSGCKLTQANILQRHGQRYPSTGGNTNMKASIDKLKKASSLAPEVAFASSFNYSLKSEDLTRNGAAEAYQLGKQAYERYHSLGNPFVRSDSQQRCVDSAGNWTEGFYFHQRKAKSIPETLVLTGDNHTLNNACDGVPGLSSYETTWMNIFTANATARLNAAAPGANLTANDVVFIMESCGFITQVTGELSEFCNLFYREEWEGLEYYWSLDKWYGNSYGNPLGAIQGVGYVNELLSRLTGNASYYQHDRTQVNQWLDSNSITFPLNRSLLTDFTHDNTLLSIITAIGLKNVTALEASGPPATGYDFVTSQLIPMSGHLVTERLECSGENYVRFVINDQLQIPTFCSGYNSTTGLCLLENFIDSQSYARNNGNGDYANCTVSA